MPRYFFDLHNDLDSGDEEGKVLPDDEAARAHGIAEAVEMVAAAAKEHGKIDLGHWIRIRSEDSQTVAKIRFDEAVRFERDGQPV